MKYLLILFAAATLALRADDTNTVTAPIAPASVPADAPLDDAIVAHQGYPPARYESLWTKSPFAVETPEQDETESVDYSLVGIGQIDGKSYASLIQKQNQSTLLITSDKPTNGLILTSIAKKENGDTFATLTRDGQPLTLKLEIAPTAPAGVINGGVPPPGSMAPNMPGFMNQNIQMPGAGVAPGAMPSVRPLIRIHRPVIHVPQRQPQDTTVAPPVPAPPPPPAQ